MPTQIVYTAIPDQTYAGPGLRLTVMLSPRLIGPPTADLDQYPTMLDWPARVQGLRFDVDVGGLTFEAQVAPPRRAVEDRDLELWRRLFPPSCLVRSWGFVDLRSSTVLEFPATAIDRRLRAVYGTVAASGTKLPRVLDVDDLHDYTPNVVDTLLLDYEDAAAAVRDVALVAGLSAGARVVYDGLRFYRRSTDVDIDVAAHEPELDFHQRVALLGDHPTLLRRCGLAFDLVLPTASLGMIPQDGGVQILPRWRGDTNADDLRPRTWYETRAGRFRTASTGGLVENGYLDPTTSTGAISVVQLDGDGALLQVATTMGSIRAMLTDPHTPPQHDQALPALRSGGITLVHAGRGAWLASRLQAQQDIGDYLDNIWLGAEDLVRGWRIDVQVGGVWHSLHRRHGKVFGDDDQDELVDIPADQDEEGYVKLASATAPTFRPGELYLHEAVAGWSGWSLSATRPGKAMEFVPAVRVAGSVTEPAHQRKIDNHNDPGSMPLYTRYRATPGSLPKLRFGQTYRVRARAVDLAGGGLPHTHGDTMYSIGPIRYERYEPVPPPLVVPAALMAPAESLEHMVVCTDPAEPQSYEVLTNVRHVLAPKGALDMWERHGMIDGAFSDPDAYYQLVQRERGTLLEPYIDTRAGRVDVTDRQLCNPASMPDQSTAWPTVRGAPLAQGQYVICTGERVRMPWLPDRQAKGVVVWNAHDPLETPVIRLFQTRAGADPLEADLELDSLKVVLHTADAGATPRIRDGSALDREIHVDLPPGDRMELRYASLPRDVNIMALWNLMTEADRQGVARAIEEGRHWMFSPARTLTLVHAAQRPVLGPRFESQITIIRVPGEARARFDATLSAHAHSTSHVDVRASWPEVRDDGDTGPSETVAESDVCRIAFGYDDTVLPTSTTVQLVERRPYPSIYKTLLSKELRAPDANYAFHDLPDTRRRIVTYTPIGTTRWQEYFPLDVIADPHTPGVSNLQTAGIPHAPVSIPASAPPDAPQVAQILPTFRREGSARTRSRSGNGFRIYLERPWFSSGVGERLAILVERDGVWPPQPTPADWLEKVSRWGADPVWTRPAPHPRPLSTSAFVIDPNDGVPAFGGLEARARVEVVPEINGTPVDAIVVVPEFSEERQQWYCDLELSGMTYFPFLSLALARYQDDSVHFRGLSPVVRAELVQVAPDRYASVTVSPNGKKATVIVRGVSAGNLHEAQHTGNPGGAHRVRARVEIPKAGGTELDWNLFAEADLVAQWANADEIEWSATLAVKATAAWRIVIEERELYTGEDHGSGAAPGERITYVEILTRT